MSDVMQIAELLRETARHLVMSGQHKSRIETAISVMYQLERERDEAREQLRTFNLTWAKACLGETNHE